MAVMAVRVIMRVVMVVAVAVVIVMMCVIGVGADAADVMVVAGLRRAGVVLVADDLGAVLAELAVHAGLAIDDLADTVGKAVEHKSVVAQIGRVEDLDLGMLGGDAVGGGVDALHQDAGEEEIG